MIGVLQDILCAIRNVLLAVAWAGVELVNLLVKALGAFATALVILLPQMPAVPQPPEQGVLQWLSWLYPLPGLLAVFGTVVTLFVAFLLLRVALKWVKAL